MLQKHLHGALDPHVHGVLFKGGPVNGIASQHLHPCGYQEGLPRELVTVRIASHRSSSVSYQEGLPRELATVRIASHRSSCAQELVTQLVTVRIASHRSSSIRAVTHRV